jgi:hypothetical protein
MTPPRSLSSRTSFPSIGTRAAPAVDAQRGQGSTDRPSIRHLAIALTQLPMTNSTQRRPLGPTLRHAVVMPPRRDRTAQSTQSDATPPCTNTRFGPVRHTIMHGDQPQTQRHPRLAPASPRPTPASPVSDITGLKPSVIRPNSCATDASHLVHRLHARCRPSQPTTTPNGRRRRRTIDRAHIRQIKAEAPSRSHPSLSFAPLHSPSPAGTHRRAAEMKSSPENASSSVRLSTGRGEGCSHPSLSPALFGSRACFHRLDLTSLCS